jgi:ADP-heptose:LPS heptosyltransferase
VILRIASSKTSAGRLEKYEPTSADGAPSTFDGRVAIRHVYRSLPEFKQLSLKYPDAPADHPNIAVAAELIRNWPVAFEQCQRLLDAIHPATDPNFPTESAEIYRGSSSHSFERHFGTVWATIYCPIGLAQAIVHEMAHQKLRVLGVSFESATTVVGNDPSAVYVSPIIKGRLRPMTAVLHAEYSYVHVTAFDIHLVEMERDHVRREALQRVLRRNLLRIQEGYETICQHFEPGEHGREFMEGFSGWIRKTIESGQILLGRPVRGSREHLLPLILRDKPSRKPRIQDEMLAARTPTVFAFNGGIGDRLCNLPALRALSALFPGRMGLICNKGDRELYYSDLNLRIVQEIEFERAETGWNFDVESVARKLGDCDLLLCINPWTSSSVSQLLSYFPTLISVGFFQHFRNHLRCDYHGHAIDMAFAIPAFLNPSLNIVDYSQPPALSDQSSSIAENFKRRYVGLQRTICVHTETSPKKRWPDERFRHVLDRFLGDFPDHTALVIDLQGEGFKHSQLSDRLLSVNLPLGPTLAVLRNSDLFLGIDSCFLHAADLFRVPGVGLFGPTTCRRWGYRFAAHRHFQGSEVMETIEVDEVYGALSSLAKRNIR